jgi:hypothetical protein
MEKGMLEFLDNHPIIKFFTEIGLYLLLGTVIVLISSQIWSWSVRRNYSDGYFFVAIMFAAIGSSKAILSPRRLGKEPSEVENKSLPAASGGFAGFLSTRSFSFRMMVASLFSFIISVILGSF